MDEKWTKEVRKKEFDKLFKTDIVPLFKQYAFFRHTKTSKRLCKSFENQLSVFLFFEYKNFGEGFYDLTISYFDAELGDVYDDMYLAIAAIQTPKISGNSPTELGLSVTKWLEAAEASIIPFILKHASHKAIAASDQFYISKGRAKVIEELFQRKS